MFLLEDLDFLGPLFLPSRSKGPFCLFFKERQYKQRVPYEKNYFIGFIGYRMELPG